MRRIQTICLCMLLPFLFGGCGYNRIQSADEDVKAQLAEMMNQYKRRADLVPALVNTVTGYATQEQEVLIRVAEARARVGSIQASEELADDAPAMARFQAAQGELSSALSRLLMVTENYPVLKSDERFRDLQVQLEGTENRIAVARTRYVQSVRDYNVLIRGFPVNTTARLFGYSVKPNFEVANPDEIARPPEVDFSELASRRSLSPAPTAARQPQAAPDATD
ncbi:LemA family protein [Dokdonella immobilis]|uniref:LemA protein n=1 Tax=Dokdonella immobilis TaxID=578942 RepID=A0A1I4W836_9GAMM|nr:LemA family protein [Dokdonella immobilis]SFN09595.1 LemA protein [Dokdonella immobilis]